MLLKEEYDIDHDHHMGSNCRFLHFSRDKAEIKPSDESKFDLSEVIKKKDNNFYLHIIQNSEFDLTQLRFERGLKFNKDGPITRKSDQAFKLNLDEIKLSAACLELGSASIGFSHENFDKMFTQHKTYTKHVKKALNDTTHVKLHEISEKYDHFCARRLIVGGIIVRNEEYIDNLGEYSKIKGINTQISAEIAANSLKTELNNAYKNENIFVIIIIIIRIISKQLLAEIILRTQKFWRQSLNDSTRWKIIVYEEVYLLFESLEEKLKKEVLAVMGHQILEAKVDYNIKEYESNNKMAYIQPLKTDKIIY
ncbi:hypothetical protein F8M41_016725 [Gigaspora margarita]|uniref:Uncharacterized protein n=1 Tax=Gigaspora margarita TaxID=4874 RepID=A0A8H4EMJ5_GIGMA|nr:hypothetical protein F8M41_016725 [Gigaspora margarita]